MSGIEPTAAQLAQLSALPDDAPVVMINLLRFKRPGGAESYARYGELVQPHLGRVGAEVLYQGAALQMVVGPEQHAWWDLLLAVRYPSAKAFLEMVADPGYGAIHEHRAAGLERTELIATTPGA